MAAVVPPVQPAPINVPLQQKAAFTSQWVQWFDQVRQTSFVVVTNQTDITALTAALSTVEGEITVIDSTLIAQAAEILALQVLQTMIDLPRNWTPELEELRRLSASVETPRDFTRELDELRAWIASIDTNAASIAAALAAAAGLTLPLAIASGGTGAASAPAALTALGAQAALPTTWSTWTPTVAGGSMTISGLTITNAQYVRNGAFVEVDLQISFTTAGSASTTVTATLPVANVGNGSVGASNAVSAGVWLPCTGFFGTTISVTYPGGGLWPIGAGQQIYISGRYRVA